MKTSELSHIFHDIEKILADQALSDEERIDSATSIFRSHTKYGIDEKIIHYVAGDLFHQLLKNHISYFRTYMPLMLRIYRGLTGSTDAYYIGFIPGRAADSVARKIKPSLVLQAFIDDDSFNWGTGEIFESFKLSGPSSNGQRLFLSEETVLKGIEVLINKEVSGENTLILPIHIQRNENSPKELYGFIALLSREGQFSKTEISLANKITSYFTSHLRNFEILRKDQLTQFYNQRQKEDLFIAEIKKAIQNDYRVGLLLLDIDNFKNFNDNYGHLNGDSLLSQFGKLILDNIRPYDRAIRVGGEEFLIIAPKVDCESLQSFAERLRILIEKQVFMDRFGAPAYRGISASFGILLLEDIENKVANTEFYFELADKNLYAAKRMGKNRIVYSAC